LERSGLYSQVSDEEVIGIPERGYTDIDSALWSRLSEDDGFRQLLDKKIITAAYQSGDKVRLEGSCYVGRIRCGAITVELREKVKGALGALLQYATHESFKIEPADSVSSELGDMVSLLIHQYLLLVTDEVFYILLIIVSGLWGVVD
jgi:hypothetical protein